MTATVEIPLERIEAAAEAVIERLMAQALPSMRDLGVVVALDRAYGPGSRAEREGSR